LDKHFSWQCFEFSENDKRDLENFETVFSLWKDLRPHAAEARALLRRMRAECNDTQWENVQTFAPGLEEIRLALELHGEQFEMETGDRAASPTSPGPKPKRLDQKMAASLSREILVALHAAGIDQGLTLTSPRGPVARIGAAIWTMASGVPIEPATFAARVAKGLKKSPAGQP